MGLSKEVVRLDKEGNEIERFRSVAEVSKIYDLTLKQIRDICKKKVYPISENHIFRYVCDVEEDIKNGISLATTVFRSPYNMSNKRLTTEEFIERARKIHGDKYDYSKAEYKTMHEEVCIICPVHGEFWQVASVHLAGSGCSKCIGRQLTTEEIIEKFKEVHGDKYDYSKVDYTRGLDKVCIICPKHGEFWVKPKEFLGGSGCPDCGRESSAKSRRLPIREFIRRAIKVHGNKYDYSKVEYNSIDEKVTIICPIHGEFRQKAYDHLVGHGCSYCNESSLERQVRVFLEKEGIKFTSQANSEIFHWLERLSLDFYLPYHNVTIECQGRQHFEAVDKFGGQEGFIRIKERDKRKQKLCEDNGIKLLYYSDIHINGEYELGKVIPNLNELKKILKYELKINLKKEKEKQKEKEKIEKKNLKKKQKELESSDKDKPIKCPYCERRFGTYNGLAKHVIKEKAHGEITREQLLTDYAYNGVRPKCKCGCGGYTEIRYDGGANFADYVRGHSSRVHNNWGHNQKAIERSAETRREQYASGERVQWNKGKSWEETYTPEQIAKLKEVYEDEERNRKISEALSGMRKSEEHRLKMIERLKKGDSDFQISSKAEEEFVNNFIEPLNIHYIRQYYFRDIHQLSDVYIPSLNLVIEFDGDFWHCNPELFPEGAKYDCQKDKIKYSYFDEKGINYLRIWENDVNNKPELIKETIINKLNELK